MIDANSPIPNIPDIAAPLGQTWVVLVVDDDVDVHTATRVALQDVCVCGRSLELIDAYTGAEAINVVLARPDIDLLLLDTVMETDNAGLDCARHLRRSLGTAGPKIIVRSGFAGLEFEQNPRAIKEGIIDAFIKKSMTTRELLISAICNVLSRRMPPKH